MAQMLNGLKILYSGEKAFERQLSLFSICGIVGLVSGYLTLAQQGIIEITITNKILISLALILYTLFLTGYEILFMKERTIPDIDINSFKIAFHKIPLIVFSIVAILLLISTFTKFQYICFCLSAIITVPLTTMQAGFSYNFDNDFSLKFLSKLNLRKFFFLLIKNIWITIITYLIVFFLIFAIFFIAGLIIAIFYKADINAMSLAISTNQIAIGKLSNYIFNILFIYITTIGTLVWDYELIKTLEN